VGSFHVGTHRLDYVLEEKRTGENVLGDELAVGVLARDFLKSDGTAYD